MTMNNETDETKWVTIDLGELADAEDEAEAGQEDESEDDEQDESDVKADSKQEVERKSRAQDRIRQLVAAKKAADDEKEKLRAELEELRANSMSVRKQSLTSQESLIEQQIETTKRELKRAIEDGDVEAQLTHSEKLADLKVDKRIVSAQANKIPEKQETQTRTQTRNEDIPEEMHYWIQENEWFLKPQTREERKKQRLVVELGAELVKDGYSEHDPEFYDELEARLQKSFAKSGSDDVVLNKETDSSSARKTSKPAVQVSGASRAPVTTRRNGKVALTPEERTIARRLNLSENDYALSKVKKEKSDNGWTTIG